MAKFLRLITSFNVASNRTYTTVAGEKREESYDT